VSFEFRSFLLPEDEDQVLELLLLGFPELKGTSSGTIEHLRWKFSRSLDPPTCVVGFEGDTPVSFYGVIPQEYQLNGKRRRFGLVVDVMSHPDVRRRGLFEASGRATMARMDQTPIEAVIGFPIRGDVMPGHLKIGWQIGFHLPIYVLPVGPHLTDEGGVPWWMRLYGFAATLYRYVTRPLRIRRDATEEPLDIDTLLRHGALSSSPKDGHERHELEKSEDFLRWRLSRPGTDYRAVSVAEADSSGVAIISEQLLRGIRTLCVLQMWVSGPAGTRLLTGALVRAAQDSGVAAIATCANPSHAAQLGLCRVGFIRTPMKFTLIFRATGDEAVDHCFSDESHWRMSWLDSDTT
jgi:hypothetical protein